jgi:hypothetical protein
MTNNTSSVFVVSDTIIVKVGAEGKKYTLHKKLLLYHSSYFRGALSGGFKETNDGVVLLDDVATDVFDIFVDWLYEKKLPNCVEANASSYGEVSIRFHSYVLADRLIAPGFKTAIFDTIFNRHAPRDQPPPYYAISFVFNNLCRNDPLLQFVVDLFCVKNGVERYPWKYYLDGEISNLPKDALIRLLKKMHAITGLRKDEKRVKRCDYEV